jgi:hypothetical protein
MASPLKTATPNLFKPYYNLVVKTPNLLIKRGERLSTMFVTKAATKTVMDFSQAFFADN